MELILIIVVLLLLFGGGGGYWSQARYLVTRTHSRAQARAGRPGYVCRSETTIQ